MASFWIFLMTATLSLTIQFSISVAKEEKATVQKTKSEFFEWTPYSKLNSYHSFQDVKMYMINVPAFTSEMALSFQYFGQYSGSHKECNNTVTVLLQQGSPAVPYRDDVTKEYRLFNNTDTYKTVVSLGKSKLKIIKSPTPGYWFVTTFLPAVEKVEKIKEQGLSKPDEKCLSAVIIVQNLTWAAQSAEVIGKGQTFKSTIGIRKRDVKVYQYFVPDHSKNLIIKLKNHCLTASQNCSLKYSVSAKSLPSSVSKSCPPNEDCIVNVKWPQVVTNYYMEISGVNSSYEVTVNHTDCEYGNMSCYPVSEINLRQRVHLHNVWIKDVFASNSPSFFSLTMEPNYVGTTLVVRLAAWGPEPYKTTYKMCIHKDSPPIDAFSASSPLSNVYCNTSNNSNIAMKVLFPQPGKWYIGVGIHSSNTTYSPIIRISAETQACLDPLCSGHGYCQVAHDVSISYGVCKCDYGYSGWTCAQYHGLDILAICLLTISNIAFLPGIFVAWKRKFYPESIVYLFNMYCSTVYHACDSHGYCIYDYDTLQLSDFFASILSVWYTLIVMVKLPLFWHRTINIFALLCIFLGIQLSRFGVTMIAVPGGTGIAIVLLSFGLRSYYRRKCFPAPKRWLFFVLPAGVLAIVAIIVYSLLETTANYKYLHSLWHICIALSVPLLLPSVRQQKLFAEYNMIENLDDADHFRDSDESLLLNPWETKDDNNQSEDEQLPKLIV